MYLYIFHRFAQLPRLEKDKSRLNRICSIRARVNPARRLNLEWTLPGTLEVGPERVGTGEGRGTILLSSLKYVYRCLFVLMYLYIFHRFAQLPRLEKRTERIESKRCFHRRFIIQRGHEHTRTGNWSERGFGSLRQAPQLGLYIYVYIYMCLIACR